MADRKWRFVLFQDKDKQWRWRFEGPNNRIVATGAEGYHHLDDALHGISDVTQFGPAAEIRHQHE